MYPQNTITKNLNVEAECVAHRNGRHKAAVKFIVDN